MSGSLQSIDTVLRLLAVGAALALMAALSAGRIAPPLKTAILGVLFCSACYAINSSTVLAPQGSIDFVIDMGALFTPFFTWIFARRLFDREPPRWITIAWATGLAMCGIAANFVPASRTLVFIVVHVGALAFMIDVFRIAWMGRDDDLVEKRRLLRLGLPVSIGLLAAAILLTEFVTGSSQFVMPLQVAVAATILVLLLFAAITLLDPDEDLLAARAPDMPDPPAHTLSPAESVLKDKLEAAMAEGAYRTPGLTIVGLAELLDTSEHRLRALINRRLGYRNFSGFLNAHRIAEARERLADRDAVDLPVTTIAMDLGYNALPTFNRAFREATGQTPTEYRKSAFAP